MTCMIFNMTFFCKNTIPHFIDTDDCNSNPCNHEGTCTDGMIANTCKCTTGYTGVNCETIMSD